MQDGTVDRTMMYLAERIEMDAESHRQTPAMDENANAAIRVTYAENGSVDTDWKMEAGSVSASRKLAGGCEAGLALHNAGLDAVT